jgi:hypothetical protein
MLGRRNRTTDIWRAVVVAGAMLGTGAGCSAPTKTPLPQPTAVPAEETGAPPVEHMGTGSAGGESIAPPVEKPAVDAGTSNAAPRPSARGAVHA